MKSEANVNLTWSIKVDIRKQNHVCVGDVQMGFGSLTWASSFFHRNIHLGVLKSFLGHVGFNNELLGLSRICECKYK